VVGTGAILLGPSFGHFYSDRPGRAFAGIGVRVLASAAVVVASLGGISEAGTTSGQATLAVIGGIIVGASVIYDIAEAPHSAQIHNDRVRRGLAAIGVSPSVDSRGVGLRATVSF
jgi:Zn-dependent protease